MTYVNPFHTDTTLYRTEDQLVYHDQEECGYGKEIKKDGNALDGTAGRRRCDRCNDIATGVAS
ncbi:MAG TPA: hypothetical protein VMA83_05995 [Solirubrobacteraceae bacterium]|nr:hypothetical protein [Solirubrobacteraceae bacterium]